MIKCSKEKIVKSDMLFKKVEEHAKENIKGEENIQGGNIKGGNTKVRNTKGKNIKGGSIDENITENNTEDITEDINDNSISQEGGARETKGRRKKTLSKQECEPGMVPKKTSRKKKQVLKKTSTKKKTSSKKNKS